MPSGPDLIAEINSLSLAPGAAAFWWLGQLGFVVKVGETVIYLDPYLAPSPRRLVAPLLAACDVSNARWLFCSHHHSDHLDRPSLPVVATASPGVRVVASLVSQRTLLKIGIPEERTLGLDEGQAYEEEGLRITPIAAQHEFFDRDPVLGYPYLGWVLEIGGVTLYHSGDTLCYDGLLARLRRWSFDLVFLPINGRDAVRYRRGCIGNMTYQEAVDLTGQLAPRLAVPGHYDMFADNSADPQLYADYMRAKFPRQAFWLGEHGQAVILSPR